MLFSNSFLALSFIAASTPLLFSASESEFLVKNLSEVQKIRWISATEAKANMSQLIPAGINPRFSTSYVARGRLPIHNNRWIPGKAYKKEEKLVMYYAYRGEELSTEDFELLVVPFDTTTWIWMDSEIKVFPKLAIVGGLEPNTVETMYICRGTYDNYVITGNLLKSSGVCSISYNYGEVRLHHYELLVINPYGESLGLSNYEPYQLKAEDIHNEYRAIHHVDPLTLSDELNNRAFLCATYYASPPPKGNVDYKCPYLNGYGQNIWSSCCSPPSPEVATNDAVRLNWYFEERIHNYTCNCNKNSGQFTQIVWKSSREMGFGVATVGNFTAACALYYPRGNIKEEFLENVLSP